LSKIGKKMMKVYDYLNSKMLSEITFGFEQTLIHVPKQRFPQIPLSLFVSFTPSFHTRNCFYLPLFPSCSLPLGDSTRNVSVASTQRHRTPRINGVGDESPPHVQQGTFFTSCGRLHLFCSVSINDSILKAKLYTVYIS